MSIQQPSSGFPSIKSQIALLYIFIAVSLGGGIAVLGKIGLRVFPPFSFTFFRFLVVSLLMIPLFLRSGGKFDNKILRVIPMSFLAVGNVTLAAFGFRLTSATVAQLLYTLTPIVTAIIAYFLLREVINIKKVVGIGIGLIGALVIILLPVLSGGAAFQGNLLGNLFSTAGMVCFSFYSVLSKKYQRIYSPIYLTTVFALTTTFSLSPFAVYEYTMNPRWFLSLNIEGIASLLYVAIFGGVIYYILYQKVIKAGGPVLASTSLFIQPAMTYLWAYVILSERLTYGIVIGAMLTLSGAWIVSRSNNYGTNKKSN